MADMFEDYSMYNVEKGEHLVSDEGLHELENLYSSVPVEIAPIVAAAFLEELATRGINPSPMQVQEPIPHS